MIHTTVYRLLAFIVLLVAVAASAAERPRAVIVFIGDGMGPEHVRAAGMFAGDKMSFEAFEHRGEVTTKSANNDVTDSAAAATAIATGVKVNNGVIAKGIPGSGDDLPTILEQLKARGWATGIVTNDALVGATPAAFAAHTPIRNNARDIVRDYLTQTRPEVMMGGGGGGMTAASAAAQDYSTFTDVAGMRRIAASLRDHDRICGVFGNGRFPYRYHDQQATGRRAYGVTHPPLEDMTTLALNVLARDPQGFFLTIESAMTDKSGHASRTKNNLDRLGCNVFGTITMSRAVRAAVDWAKDRDDVLIVVTSDHETGGMKIERDNGRGALPTVEWAHKSHTGVNVYVWARGPGAERFTGVIDNTDIYRIIADLCGVVSSSAAQADAQ